MKLSSLIVLSISLNFAIANNHRCPSSWSLFDHKCYRLIVSSIGVNHQSAVQICSDHGGSLPEIVTTSQDRHLSTWKDRHFTDSQLVGTSEIDFFYTNITIDIKNLIVAGNGTINNYAIYVSENCLANRDPNKCSTRYFSTESEYSIFDACKYVGCEYPTVVIICERPMSDPMTDSIQQPASSGLVSNETNQEPTTTIETNSTSVTLARCPESWSEFEGHCYKTVHFEMFNEVSQYACRYEGSHQVSIMSEEELDFITNEIRSQLATNVTFWTGLNCDTNSIGSCQWSDGSRYIRTVSHRWSTTKNLTQDETQFVVIDSNDLKWRPVSIYENELFYTICKKRITLNDHRHSS